MRPAMPAPPKFQEEEHRILTLDTGLPAPTLRSCIRASAPFCSSTAS